MNAELILVLVLGVVSGWWLAMLHFQFFHAKAYLVYKEVRAERAARDLARRKAQAEKAAAKLALKESKGA